MIAAWPSCTPMTALMVQASKPAPSLFALVVRASKPAPLRPWLSRMFSRPQKESAIDRSPSEDARDIQAAATGDGEAYARLIARHQPHVAKRMLRFTRNPAQIEELTHDVFVETYFSLKRYRGDAPFEHWLQRITTRIGYRFWKQDRRNRKRQGLLESHAREASPPATSSDDATDTLDRILSQLPPRDRLVITLLHLEEKSVEETARLTGWSKVMVKVQAHRARAKLRRLMEKI
jgi:RNA polymerase sigma-70 factor, ECF subfamily